MHNALIRYANFSNPQKKVMNQKFVMINLKKICLSVYLIQEKWISALNINQKIKKDQKSFE